MSMSKAYAAALCGGRFALIQLEAMIEYPHESADDWRRGVKIVADRLRASLAEAERHEMSDKETT